MKKWLGALLQPLPVLVIILLFTLWLMLKGRHKAAIWLQSLSVLLLIAVTTPPLADYLVKQVEGNIAQFDESLTVDFVVVLGCGHVNDRRIPITAQIDSCSLHRVTEGVRIARQQPGARIVFSGYGGSQPMSNAETNKELAMALGISEHRITVFSNPKDTREEAQLMTPVLTNKKFALVTSASHMPRAIEFFRQQKLTPIPAPTGHLHREEGEKLLREYLPDAHYLHKTETATYEFLGRLWQKLTE
ncbi:ElyC/SanA/YdcF family protein [Planctobacterium marinum]|uniref:ElyC/SanA/YdcF family protein n=1 Tax=Planctobacterium marinum TaxID=1631968 RepID=UPI001E5A5469|nr:ElyC/SanA/YdcF family protein [Planctobacterium marinum]